MAHNFHDICGMLVIGIDFHKGIQPLPPPPHPMMYWELVFTHPFILGPGQHPEVKFNGVNSVVHMHTPLLLWGHLPIIPDPLNLKFWEDILSGSHIAWLPRTTVKIGGTSAACCVFPGPASINMDCCEAGFLPLSVVLQPGTVQTTPTLKDYLLGALAVAVQVAFDKGLSKLGEKLFKSKWGVKLARKARKSPRTNALTNRLAARLGKMSGKTGREAYKAGMDHIANAIGGVIGNNPIEAGTKALGLLGVDVPAHIRAAAQGDDSPGGPSVPTIPKIISHLTEGNFPNASKAISNAESLSNLQG